MNRYHFSFGDSEGGAVGLCFDVLAESEEQAVDRARLALEQYEIEPAVSNMDTPGVDYSEIRIYTNPKHVTTADIDDVEEGVE